MVDTTVNAFRTTTRPVRQNTRRFLCSRSTFVPFGIWRDFGLTVDDSILSTCFFPLDTEYTLPYQRLPDYLSLLSIIPIQVLQPSAMAAPWGNRDQTPNRGSTDAELTYQHPRLMSSHNPSTANLLGRAVPITSYGRRCGPLRETGARGFLS